MTPKTRYEGYRNASGRLRQQPVEPLRALKSDLPREQAEGIHAFDLAHAVMLTETGIIPTEIGQPILRTLSAISPEHVLESRANAGGGIHSGEQLLITELGIDFGGYLHIGRSSGDLGETSKRIALRRHIQMTASALTRLRSALIDKSKEHVETIMPAYTHGLHAQPTSFAHFLLMHEASFARDTDRILASYERINLSPAGAAIMTGSDFPLDRQRVSDLLGFIAPIPHTMDAILSHDVDTEYAAVLAIIAQNLSRLCDDLMQFATNEFAMLELADRHCGTSSIMPQKKNPDILEYIKSISGESLGAVTMMAVNERGPSGWPVLERRENHRMLWALGEKLAERLTWMVDVIEGLIVHEDRMLLLANTHWSTATDLASLLVRRGDIDWRTAHGLVGKVVKHALENGLALSSLSATHIADITDDAGINLKSLSDADIRAALDARMGVERRTGLGGPASTSMKNQLDLRNAQLGEAINAVTVIANRDQTAKEILGAAIIKILHTKSHPDHQS